MIKKERSEEIAQHQKNKKKMQSAPRGSRQVWSIQGDAIATEDDKARKKVAVQNFIENAKKNKFSEWRKSKMGFSDNSNGD